MKLRVRNWRQFQHYKDRNPPWIKLHFSILSSSDWVTLDDACRVLAIACMLIASRSEGEIDGSEAGLAYLQRVAYLNELPNLSSLIECGFLEPASTCKRMLASARPETETEKKNKNTPVGVPDPIWGPGLSILTSTGIPEGQARAFVGTLMANWEQADVLAALTAASGKADPRAYSRKILSAKPRKAKAPPGTEAMLATLRAEYGAEVRLASSGKEFVAPGQGRAWFLNGEQKVVL